MKSLARDYPTDHLQIIYHFISEKPEQGEERRLFYSTESDSMKL